MLKKALNKRNNGRDCFIGNFTYFQIQLPPLPANITLVEKDAPILQVAIEVQATHLLTGDVKHFAHLFGVTIEGVLSASSRVPEQGA